ncbi:hypothetical protein [Bacterioplanoides sp.]|uniref:hypothetical protein n=1 Tax=Bacterioplanoides sp. TaxID=2066072 RepID=UPI003B598216
MTEVLTPKQIANRLYYAKHAEKIKAQKRAAYAESKAEKPVRKAENHKPAAKKVSTSPETTKTRAVRNRIEDFKLARELGVGISDL